MSRLLVISDIKISLCDDKFYLESQYYYIIERYYKNFGKLDIIARCKKVDSVENLNIAPFFNDVINVSFLDCLFNAKTKRKVSKVIENADLIAMREPSIICSLFYKKIRKQKKKVLAELMGDAWDAYANHGLLGKLIAPYMHQSTKKIMKEANYALYVTNEYLQKKYPSSCKSIAASNVQISDCGQEVIERRKEKVHKDYKNEISLMTTASLNVRLKGQMYVIKALAILKKHGINAKYYLVGGGDKQFLQKVAKRSGVEDRVIFCGRMPLDDVLKKIDDIDIYLQPSLQEGLPRSVIEAMSRGCHAIGFRTAGIPELLLPEYVVERKDYKGIAAAIVNYIDLSVDQKINLIDRNYEESKKYFKEILDKKRVLFYNEIKSELEWQSLV